MSPFIQIAGRWDDDNEDYIPSEELIDYDDED